MYTWPTLELTDYEKRFVRVYKDGKYPGVLRRAYEMTFNTVADPLTPGLESIKLSGRIQIARRSRVFGLSFAGNLGTWRLQIETASGEQMTPKGISDGYPIVSSMIAGSSWNGLAAIGAEPMVNDSNGVSHFIGSFTQGPLLIDPNWELSPNETLIFNGFPIDVINVEPTAVGPAQSLLSVVAHVWEFPGMDGRNE
jgi:hypothetical protein